MYSLYTKETVDLNLFFLSNLKELLGESDQLKVIYINGSNLDKDILDENKSNFELANVEFDVTDEPAYIDYLNIQESTLEIYQFNENSD